MKELAADSWVQVLGFIAALCAGMMALGPTRGPDAAAAPAAPSAPASPPAVGPSPRAPEPAPAPAAPPMTPIVGPEALPSAPRTPKFAGLWVVDAKKPGDEDSASLQEAVYNAKDGDEIHVRPGVYKGPMTIARNISIIGYGARRGDVVIVGDGAAPIVVSAGSVALKNLAISRTGAGAGYALVAAASRLSLSGVDVDGGPGPEAIGLHANGATVTASDCRFSAAIAVHAENQARVELTGCAVEGRTVGLSESGTGTSARLVKTTLRGAGRGLEVSAHAKASVENSNLSGQTEAGAVVADGELTLQDTVVRLDRAARLGVYAENSSARLERARVLGGSGAAVKASRGSTLVLDQATLQDNGVAGAVVDGGSRLQMTRSSVSGSGQCALHLDSGEAHLSGVRFNGNLCGIAIGGPAVLESNGGSFSGNKKGPLLVKPGIVGRVELRGSGNIPPLKLAASGPMSL